MAGEFLEGQPAPDRGDGWPPGNSQPSPVDAKARALLTRFYRDNDGKAFGEFTQLVSAQLIVMAEAAIADQAVLTSADQLAKDWLGRIFTDTKPGRQLPRSVMGAAAHWLRERARAFCERTAGWPLVGEDGYSRQRALKALDGFSVAEVDAETMYTIHVAFHRLPIDLRQVKRACEADFMLPEDVAERFGLTEAMVLERLHRARHLIDDAVIRLEEGRQDND